ATPSVPRPTATPAASMSTTGAAPLESFMLLDGLCATPVLLRRSLAISSAETQTQCAASVRGPSRPSESRYAVGDILQRVWIVSFSVLVSERWISSDAPKRLASACDCLSSSGETV